MANIAELLAAASKHYQSGRRDLAINCLRQALQLRPNIPKAHNNLGVALVEEGRRIEAIVSFREALRLKADYPEAHNNLGNALRELDQPREALVHFREALRLRPAYPSAHSNLILTLHYLPGYDARAIHEECRRWNHQHAEPLRGSIQPHDNVRDPERRLRVGYVSLSFRDHVCSFFTLPLLSRHDHRQVEVYCYADVERPDAVTERHRGYADVWRDTTGMTDAKVAELVRGDRIDILVDLAMHTAGNRLLMFARKPAPVQVAWLAYPGTTGLDAMDYRLTDPYLDPPGLFDACYPEQSLRLPQTFWCYDPLTDGPPVNALPAVSASVFTFASLNALCKINEGCLALWARVLRELPRSRLLLLAPPGDPRRRVQTILEGEGISADRLAFSDRLPRAEYLRLYHQVDLCLDPMPYNGHTTSLDALWMGVPTITLVSTATAFGRAGFSQLSNLGLTELAADTADQYVATTARLAGDWPRLQELRATLRQRLQQSPLMDAARFARNVEECYRLMWRRWSQPAQTPQAAPVSLSQTLELARTHYQAGRLEQAEQLYRQILQGDPNQVDALHLLGLIAGRTERYQLASDYLRNALRLNPDYAEAHNNLGNVYILQGKLPEAVASFRQAVRAKPDYVAAYNNLGNALRELGQPAEAVASLRQALRLRADYADAHANLGLALQAQGQRDEAEVHFQRAQRLKQADAHANRGNVCKDRGQIAEAIACYDQALQLVPDFLRTASNRLYALHYRGGITLGELAASHADFGRRFGTPLEATWQPHSNRPDPDRRLRIGFLSPNLHRHPVGYFLIGFLDHLDRQQVEVACYSNAADQDALTARLRSAVAGWQDVYGWTDEDLAQRIRADGIDILFDLAGHSARNRLLVFARKPAPIQVSWVGYPGETGLRAMDYILADRYEIPPEAEPHYALRVLRMPHAYVCYEPPDYAPAVSALPAQERGYVTFASFNNPAKIGPEVIAIWAQILQRLPQARLVLKYKGMGESAAASRFAQMFAGHGVDSRRVAFLGRSPHAELLAQYQGVDVGLDTFPYNGGLTTLEAVWMGVPVVTWPGQTFAGRHSLTHLANMGLTQMIAANPEEYVAVAVSLAEDLGALAALRAGLRQRMAASPLCDGKQFARDFVQKFRDIWREWCGRQSAGAVNA
jgi:predicted O-linked N-acetylglucosamine transferase (SPINDLY family)